MLYAFSQDAFAVLVLAAVAFALYRRLVLHPTRLEGDKLEHTDALIILELDRRADGDAAARRTRARISLDPCTIGPEKVVSRALAASSRRRCTARTACDRCSGGRTCCSSSIFLNYLPYSKHLHVVTSLINVYLSNTSGPGTRGAMRPMDLEAENASSSARRTSSSSRGRICSTATRAPSAAAARRVCPANITGKPLSPRKIVDQHAPAADGEGAGRDGRLDGVQRTGAGPRDGGGGVGEARTSAEHRLLDDYITEEELWACTSCRACVQECPVSIDQLDIINELRRNLVLSESRFPEEMQPAFESLERNGSPWAFNPGRPRRLGGRDEHSARWPRCAERGERPDVLFWVGCMGSFDDRAKKITVAFARILEACNVNFAILGQEEHCHGDPARRMGNEYLYQMLAKDTIETLDRYRREDDRHELPALLPPDRQRVSAARRQLRGHPPLDVHRAAAGRRIACRSQTDERPSGSPSRTTTPATSAATTTSTTRRARRFAARCRSSIWSSRSARATAACAAAPAAGGCSWRSGTGKRINVERTEELLATGADAHRRRVPVLHDDDERRREGGAIRACRSRHRRGRGRAAGDDLTAVVDYDRTSIPEGYDRGRDHGPEALALWMSAIETRVRGRSIERILDLGCGTGRFSQALATRFDADVVGVDPSQKMLAIARGKPHEPRVRYVEGRAEAIPLDAESVDIVFTSMTFHHFSGSLARGERMPARAAAGRCAARADGDPGADRLIRVRAVHPGHSSYPRGGVADAR